MAIKIKSTRDYKTQGVKCCVYGKAGIGKTTLMATAPRPIILSCESGLLSLADIDVPYIEITSIDDAMEAYEYLVNGEGAKLFDTICLDSISEISEVFLSDAKKRTKDPRQAYGEMNDEVAKFVRAFRDIPGKNVVFSAKRARQTDDDLGITSYIPSMPGKTLTQGLPFFFDEVFYMTEVDDEDMKPHRVLITFQSIHHDAKDRSGKLSPYEFPDLTKIFNKITGVKKKKRVVQEDDDPKTETQETKTQLKEIEE